MSRRDFSGRARPGGQGPGWVVLALPAVALVSVLLSARTARATHEAAQADLARVQRETEEMRGRVAVLQRDARRGGTRDLSRSAPPGLVLATLESTMPDDVRLEGLTLSYGADLRVQMQVEAAGAAGWDAFLQRLATHPRFMGVMPGEETREGAVKAAVAAAWKP